MWPFQRKVEAPAAEGPRPVPAPVIRRDWAGLPPIQRIVGAHPLTAPSDQFSDDLATHQDPSVTTDTMGHQVSADAPPGLVLALARPTTRSDGPAMIPRPRVQRTVAGAVTESGEWDGDEAAPDPVRPTPFPTSAPAAIARELPVVATEPPIQRLTSLAPGADPAPIAAVAQRSRAMPTPTAATAPAATNEPFEAAPIPAQRLTLGQARRLGLGAPIKQVPHPAIPQRASEPMEASSVAMPADVTAAQRVPTEVALVQRVPADVVVPARASLDLSPSTKAPMDLATGVRQASTSSPGVPLAPSFGPSEPPGLELQLAPTSDRKEASGEGRQPITPTVQLSPTSSPTDDLASVPRPSAQRQTDGATPVPPSIASDRVTGMPLAPPSVPAVSIASVQRVIDSSRRLPVVSETSASAAAMAQLAGARPLRPTAVLQRSAPADGPVVMEDTPSDPDPLQPFPLLGMRNDAPLLEPSQQGRSELGSDTPPPHRGIDFHSPHPALPRKVGREFENPQGPREVSTGRLPLAPSPGIAVQRASDSTRVPDPPPQEDRESLQAVWYENRAAVSRQSEGGTFESASPVAAAAPSLASETEMDELARKLYERIRGRLKTELLVDRERAGFLTDLR